LKIPRGNLKKQIGRQTIQWQKEKRQTMIYKTLHRKLKIEQRESHEEPRMISGAPEGLEVPAPHVAPFML
jgi:hypothetical protein